MLNKNTLFGRGAEATPREPVTTSPRPPLPTPSAPAALPGASAQPVPAGIEMPGASSQPGGSKLIVGPDIKLKGVEITDCDTLVVEGRVEATMDSRVIQIAEKGAYIGTVGIDIAEVHGRFEGELTARKRLVIHAKGSVSGTIRYGKIVVEEGGALSGDVRMLDSDAVTARVSAAAESAPGPVSEGTDDLRGVAEAISDRSRGAMLREAKGR